jgi:hypothetical protein
MDEMDEQGRKLNEKGKVSICILLRGEVLSQIELSPLEYGEIRSLPLGEALRRMLKKEPRLTSDVGLMALNVGNIKARRFEVREWKEDNP